MLNTEQARALLHRQDASLVSIRSRPEFIGTTSGYSYIKPMGRLPGPAGVMPEATPPIWRISIIRTAPCVAQMISPRCGNHGIFCRTSRSLLLRYRLARLRNLYVRPGDGLEQRLGLRRRLVRVEQQPEKPGLARGTRPGKQYVIRLLAICTAGKHPSRRISRRRRWRTGPLTTAAP